MSWYLASLSYVSIVVLVMLSGLFSGLTLGLLGLDMFGLEIAAGGDNAELARFRKEHTRERTRPLTLQSC